MPASPTAAQSVASRRNGSLSRGPTTPEGKARSAANAPAQRHGLRGSEFRLLPGEDEAEFAALRDDLLARHAPVGPAERHWVGRLAAAAWRARRLDALDELVLAASLAEVAGPEAAAGLPSLATLARYRARTERDHRQALAELDRLRAVRPRLPKHHLFENPEPARLRWIADRLEERAAARSVASGTPEPEASPAQPAPVAPEDGTASPARGTPEPEAPAATAAARPLNRAQRRRLMALERAGRRRVAAAA